MTTTKVTDPAKILEPGEPKPAATGPVIIDLGKKKRSQVKKLRKGRGRLVDRVNDVLANLNNNGSLPAGAQKVIVVVREKRKRGGNFSLF